MFLGGASGKINGLSSTPGSICFSTRSMSRVSLCPAWRRSMEFLESVIPDQSIFYCAANCSREFMIFISSKEHDY